MVDSDFRQKIKVENKKVVEGVKEDGENIEVSVNGYNIDALYARTATIGVGLFVPMAYASGYLMNDNADYANWVFTDRALIVLNCNNYGQIVSYKKIFYVEIKESILYTKTNTIKVLTTSDEKVVIEFDKDVAKDSIDKVEKKLMLRKEEKKYSSAAKKDYRAALSGSIAKGIGLGIGTLWDIDKLNN